LADFITTIVGFEVFVTHNGQDPWNADRDLLELPRHLRILFGIAIELLFIGGIFLPKG